MATVRKREWTHSGEKKTAWVVNYTDQGGKRRLKTFEKKKDADKHRLKVETEIEKGIHTSEAETGTIGDVIKAFLRNAEDRVRDGRIGRGRYSILKYASLKAEKYLGRLLITALTAERLVEHYQDLINKEGMKPVTAKEWVGIIGIIEDFAYRRGQTKRRVVPDAMRELRGVSVTRVRTFSVKEIEMLLAQARIKKWRGRERALALLNCAINIAAFSGLRYGEIMALQLDSIDFHRHIIKVRHNLTAWDLLKSPKTRAGRRDVPVSAQVLDMLRIWFAKYYVPNERGLLFRTSSGGALQQQQFRNIYWVPLLKAAGLYQADDVFHFHSLRHFCGSWMIENGLPITDVAMILGHSHFDTTLQTYAHALVGGHRRQEIAEQMIARLGEPVTANLPASALQGRDMAFQPIDLQ